jgi:hypothetical protein
VDKSRLAAAAYEGQLERVLDLIASGADLAGADGSIYDGEATGCATGQPYYVPLSEAARAGQLAVVTALLQAGAAVDQINYRNETALILAGGDDRLEIVRVLLAAGADANHVGCFGSALAYTTSRDVALALLEAGARLDVVDEFGDDVVTRLCPRQALDSADEAARSVLTAVEPYAEGGHAQRIRSALATMSRNADTKARKQAKERARYVELGAAATVNEPGWAAAVEAALSLESAQSLCQWSLSTPAAVAHPAWPDLVRRVIAQSWTYARITEDTYGVALTLDEMEEDEGSALDFYADEHLYTFDWVLLLLGTSPALEHPQWADLVIDVCQAKDAAVSYMNFADEEISALLATPTAKSHPRYGEMWAAARSAFPLGLRG